MKLGRSRIGLPTVVALATLAIHCAAPGPAGDDPESFSVVFAGDTSYGENYQADRARQGMANILVTEGYDYSPAELLRLLLSADLVIANLETPITDLRRTALVGKAPIHWGDVDRAPAALWRHNVRVVSLANNHAMDFGAAGLEQTLRFLNDAGIESFGAGMSKEEARKPWRRDVEVGGRIFPLRVIGAFAYDRTHDREYGFYASDGKPGTYALTTEIVQQVRALKVAEPEAFLVVFPHWGRNYHWKDVGQERIAHRMIDAGADLILGHGAHMMQEIELYRGRWIVYGLGNLVFNSGGRFTRFDVPPFSIPARLVVEEAGGRWRKTLRFYPIVSDNMRTDYRPRFVNRRQFDDVVQALRERNWDPAAFARNTTSGRDRIGRFLEVRLQ